MNWKRVKPIKDENAIQEFESLVQYTFPDSFKACVALYNGGRPEKTGFLTATKEEMLVKALFSFNKNDLEHIWLANEWAEEDEVEIRKQYVAFAGDDFGNSICFEKSTDNVVFLDHETLEVEFVAADFDAFLECLFAFPD